MIRIEIAIKVNLHYISHKVHSHPLTHLYYTLELNQEVCCFNCASFAFTS